MKLFTKLFSGIMLILAVSLGFGEYYTVYRTFDTTLEDEKDNAVRKHQLVKYALQADMVSAENLEMLDETTLQELVDRTEDSFNMQFELENVENMENADAADPEYLYYSIQDENGKQEIHVSSYFEQNDMQLQLISHENISSIFAESRQLQKNCGIVFLGTMLIGLIFSTLLSVKLTAPIQKLNQASKDFADGNYDRRLSVQSLDETGELTESFNQMADSITEKMDALELAVRQREDFVASFAHEIKTPMTSIIGYADMLYQKEMKPQEVQEAAGYILNEGMRMEALSFKLLELITLERQEFLLEEMSMTDFFDDVGKTVQTNAEKRGVELSLQIQEGYVRIEYDLFKTLILNLIDNALKSGGTNVCVTGICNEQLYEIEVKDNGRGIPPEEIQRITEAFYMVDKSRSRKEHGAGLGLALCEKIASIHSTKLEISSKEGIGTNIRLKLLLSGKAEMI